MLFDIFHVKCWSFIDGERRLFVLPLQKTFWKRNKIIIKFGIEKEHVLEILLYKFLEKEVKKKKKKRREHRLSIYLL